MQSDIHERARFLIEEVAIAGLSKEEGDWLRSHIESCAACAGFAARNKEMLRGLRALAFEVDPGMNRRVSEALASRAGRRTADRTMPRRGLAWAAAIVIALAAPFIYEIFRNRQPSIREDAEDQVLLERIASNVSRAIPEALEPLAAPPADGSEETR